MWSRKVALEFSHSELWDHKASLAQPRYKCPGPCHSQFHTPSLITAILSSLGHEDDLGEGAGHSVPALTILVLCLVAQGLAVCVALLLKLSLHKLPQQASHTTLLLCPCKSATHAEDIIYIP